MGNIEILVFHLQPASDIWRYICSSSADFYFLFFIFFVVPRAQKDASLVSGYSFIFSELNMVFIQKIVDI